MQFNGLAGLLRLTALLRQHSISYKIEQQVDDALEVSFALVGARIEVSISETDVEFSVFRGSEDVIFGSDALMSLLKKEAEI
jgi:hypothetical protein